MSTGCSIEGCDRKHSARGYCRMHYIRYQRHGDATIRKIGDHGMTKTKEYSIWVAMKDRCYNPKNKFYSLYGGRGIDICDEWRSNFTSFLDDMGKKPPGMSIDRIDNNKGYSKDNCRWATMKEQADNRRTTIMVTYRGKTQCIKDWCRELRLNYEMVLYYMKRDNCNALTIIERIM